MYMTSKRDQRLKYGYDWERGGGNLEEREK